MTFQEAMALVLAGKKVGSVTVFGEGELDYLCLDGDEVAIGYDGTIVDSFTVGTTALTATDYYEVVDAEDAPELWAYYDTGKGRWVSTINADQRRNNGFRVMKFVGQIEE